MKLLTLTLLRVALLALAAFGAPFRIAAAPDGTVLVPIFNGKDLTGWSTADIKKVPVPNTTWRVQDGVIVGENDEKLTGNDLWTEKSYGDFVLEFDYRTEGVDVDSGVDIREPSFQLQIGMSRSLKRDMTCSWLTDGAGDTSRYPMAGRAIGWEKYFKAGDWNTLRIEAHGDTFTCWINGNQVSHYSSARYPGPGRIGLQFHDGLKMKLWFRNIRLAEL